MLHRIRTNLVIGPYVFVFFTVTGNPITILLRTL